MLETLCRSRHLLLEDNHLHISGMDYPDWRQGSPATPPECLLPE